MGLVLGYTFYAKDSSKLIQRVSESDNPAIYGVGEVETVINLIDKKYLNPVQRKVLVESAIGSAVSNLDKYSVYIPSIERESSQMDLQTDFKGLGIEMIQYDDSIRVTYALVGSKTRQAGLDHGDVLIAINDKPMTGDTIEFSTLRTQVLAKGDSCKVTYLDYQTKDLVTKTFELIEIENNDASIHSLINDSTGIIKIKQFNSRTYEQFMQSLENLDTLSGENLDLIIDVRSNPGGYLPQVLKILDQLIYEKDLLLLKTVNREDKEKTYYSKAKNFFKVRRIAVLIDEHSASASEILAGVIQDLDRGVVLGSQSYGKGLVQEQYGLPSGGEIRLTVSEYILPSGRSIQKWRSFVPAGESLCDSLSTLEHKSKKYRRPLPNCQGIVPDYLTESDSLCQVDRFALLSAAFALESVEDIDVEEELMSFNAESELKCDPNCLSKLDSELNYILVKRNEGVNEAEKSSLATDPTVKKAIEYLEKDLKSLLKK